MNARLHLRSWLCFLAILSAVLASTYADAIRVGRAEWQQLRAEVVGFADNRNLAEQRDPVALKIARSIPGPHICTTLKIIHPDMPDAARVYVVHFEAMAKTLTPKEFTLWSTPSNYIAFGTTVGLDNIRHALTTQGGYMIISSALTVRGVRRIKPPKAK